MLTKSRLRDAGLEQIAVLDASLQQVLARLVDRRARATGAMLVDGTLMLPSYVAASAAPAAPDESNGWGCVRSGVCVWGGVY